MIITRFTYLYRAVAVTGFVLAAVAIFLPWIIVTNGSMGDLGEGTTATGWDLLNLDMSGPVEQNLFAYLFLGLWLILITAGIGALLAAVGRDPRGAGGYLATLAIGYLILIMFALPPIQDAIPIPPDACPAEMQDRIAEARASGDSALAEQLEGQCASFNAGRNRVIAIRDVRILPTFGMFAVVAGGIVAYVGGRAVGRDSEKIGRMRTYHTLLAEAHKDGRITQEEEDLLALQRRLYAISREEHEMVLRHMFPENEAFEDAVYMHQNPIDVDRLLLEKGLQDYESYVQQAYRKGAPTEEEREMLAVIRRTLNISPHDHEMVLAYLQQERRIPPPPRSDLHRGGGGRMAPEAAAPAPPPPVAAAKAGPRRLKCPKCGGPIVVTTATRPTPVVCPKCGHEGTLRT